MKKKTLGAQELALLTYVAEHGPLTVAEAVAGFGEPAGLARSTVLTVMERLRKKGRLTRKSVQGVFQYASHAGSSELLTGVVGQFVATTLRGSVSPFVAYLAEQSEVSDEELAQLEAVVSQLQKRKGEP
jgi:predicted transcriptional regulator